MDRRPIAIGVRGFCINGEEYEVAGIHIALRPPPPPRQLQASGATGETTAVAATTETTDARPDAVARGILGIGAEKYSLKVTELTTAVIKADVSKAPDDNKGAGTSAWEQSAAQTEETTSIGTLELTITPKSTGFAKVPVARGKATVNSVTWEVYGVMLAPPPPRGGRKPGGDDRTKPPRPAEGGEGQDSGTGRAQEIQGGF